LLKWIKRIGKWVIGILLIPITYILVALLLSHITVNKTESSNFLKEPIYLRTNGVHLDIILPISSLDSSVLKGIKYDNTPLSFQAALAP
jgi:hypothetical protein